jgi:AraC family transcriptional regulator
VESGVGARSTFVEDGVCATTARLNGFVVNDLVFPACYLHRHDPERGYVAIALEGVLEKTFARDTRTLSRGSALTMPPGAAHATRFGRRPTRVVVLHPAEGSAPVVPWETLLAGLRETREAARLGAAWRLAAELRAQDDAWVLAAEALCLVIVAGLIRGEQSAGKTNGARPWLEPVRERLHASLGARLTLADLADSAGVHPVHLARSFRERYGVSVGEYVRRLRLDWAAAELTTTDTPVAAVAAEAGFADQSHVTRAFKRHTGLTPGRYRRVVRG